MAHRAMDSILGPRTVRVVEEPAAASPAADACGVQNQAFSNCIYGNESDISRCQNYFDLLCQCRRSGGGAEGGAPTIA
uniref:CHCH domain-containing protein n=1 Tax=Aegilops tauschii TaxID=37682 RepID=N1QRJ1_AEGTA